MKALKAEEETGPISPRTIHSGSDHVLIRNHQGDGPEQQKLTDQGVRRTQVSSPSEALWVLVSMRTGISLSPLQGGSEGRQGDPMGRDDRGNLSGGGTGELPPPRFQTGHRDRPKGSVGKERQGRTREGRKDV